jgi:predicted nucleic acid-binding protein
MRPAILLDTGPLVALCNASDAHHAWAIEQWGRLAPPLLTCEAVISEACFLLRGRDPGPRAILEAVQRGAVEIAFRLTDHLGRVEQLMRKYARVPMSLADACLVCLAELRPESAVFTIDSDFRIYRKHGRTVIPVLMPEDPG